MAVLTNSLRVVLQRLRELEPIMHAVDVTRLDREGRGWHRNACKHVELCIDDIERAEKHETIR